MTKEQQQVREFHQMFGLTVNAVPAIPDGKDAVLRTELINEETREFTYAAVMGDITEIADALGDQLYIILGTANTYGIDLEPVFQEVHRSNMTKLWTSAEIAGAPRDATVTRVCHNADRAFVVKRPDGKVLKPPSYEPANIAAIIQAQTPTP